MKKMLNNSKGITLLVLVITIIIMLILAGVVFYAAFSENGLISVISKEKDNTRGEFVEKEAKQWREEAEKALKEGREPEKSLEDFLKELIEEGLITTEEEEWLLNEEENPDRTVDIGKRKNISFLLSSYENLAIKQAEILNIGESTFLYVVLENGEVLYDDISDVDLRKPVSFGSANLFKVTELKNVHVKKFVNDSGYALYAIATDGKVYSWGNNSYGTLGLGDDDDKWAPTLIAGLEGKNIKEIICNNGSVFALTNDGKVYSWGYNNYGQLGLGNTSNIYTPTLITSLQTQTVEKIICNSTNAFALTSDGKVYSWGENYNGVLGTGDYNNSYTPKLNTGLQTKTIKDITITESNGFAITTSGEIYSWGYNNYGQLGLGHGSTVNTPTKITTLNGISIKEVIGTGESTFAITTSNEVYAWGHNKYPPALGLGHYNDVNIPTKISSLNAVSLIITGRTSNGIGILAKASNR